MRWFYQKSGYGLGNFIMATPALQLICESKKAKVNVFFETRSIASLYSRCPFITALNTQPLFINAPFGTNMSPLKRRENESDTHAFCRILTGLKDFVIPDTYVDYDPQDKPHLKRISDKKHVAFFHGCLGTYWLSKKDIGRKLRQRVINAMLELGMVPVILGTKEDAKNFWSKNGLKGCLNFLGKYSLRETVNVLAQCDFTVSNDTGLYHAAGALKKKGIVLWKQTDMIKNMTTSKTFTHLSIFDKNIEDKILKILKNENTI